jgi:DNA-binding NarL/FixJ family response regulator
MTKPRILLADDHLILLQGLRGLLSPEHVVIGEAHDGPALVERALQLDPDVIVVDVSMPLYNGIDAVRRLRERGCRARVVFLSMHTEPAYASRALAAGAQGYVVKHAAAEELIDAIRAALRGEVFLSPRLRPAAVAGGATEPRRTTRGALELTARQREVLQLVAEGKSAREIGERLGISSRTVETHKYRMMDDLGVTTTAELIQHAVRLGLVPGRADA